VWLWQGAIYSALQDALTFPSAKDERARVRQLAGGQERQCELLAQHEDAVRRENVRPHAVFLQQQPTKDPIRNPESNGAEGRQPGQLAGVGLFTVGEDFLGNSQCGTRHM